MKGGQVRAQAPVQVAVSGPASLGWLRGSSNEKLVSGQMMLSPLSHSRISVIPTTFRARQQRAVEAAPGKDGGVAEGDCRAGRAEGEQVHDDERHAADRFGIQLLHGMILAAVVQHVAD